MLPFVDENRLHEALQVLYHTLDPLESEAVHIMYTNNVKYICKIILIIIDYIYACNVY